MNYKGKCRDCPLKEGCAEYRKVLTNEERLKSLDTKEFAKWIRRRTHGNDEYNEEVELAWERWLKAKHEE